MEFTSARFADNPTLEEILNDPDTGTTKLAKGSPENAVMAVQRALLDLMWVQQSFHTAGGSLLFITQFLDGDYGPWTTETVLAYKRHYDIHFPPDAATGIIDGFVGPTTLKWLDRHCSLLDEADAAITRHAGELAASGSVASLELGQPDGVGRTTHPTRQSAAASRAAVIDGDPAAELIYKRDLGAFALHGPLLLEWMVRELADGTGDATGNIGFPLSDMSTAGTITSAQVELGVLTHDSATGTSTFERDPAATLLRHEFEF